MRALLISDIHSNLEALEAVLAAAPRYDEVWNLGDVVGYGANPNEVIDAVRNMHGIVVRGNHDRACSGLMDIEDFSPLAARAVEWTQAVLSPERREWLRDLATGPLMADEPEVSCVHGSPVDEDEYVESEESAIAAMYGSPGRITFFGHTHKQMGFATNGAEWLAIRPLYESMHDAETYTLDLKHGARYLLNPGSVGQPRDGDWRAAFAIYDNQQALLTWHRVPYEIRKAQQRIRNAGLPDLLAARLDQGR